MLDRNKRKEDDWVLDVKIAVFLQKSERMSCEKGVAILYGRHFKRHAVLVSWNWHVQNMNLLGILVTWRTNETNLF